MLNTRVLPYAEWGKLKETELLHLATMPADNPGVKVVVVEDDSLGVGEPMIVACWAALVTVHVEGLWQKPEVRNDAAVGRALLAGMSTVLQDLGAEEVVTVSNSTAIDAMLTRIGGKMVDGRMWVFPVHQIAG